MRCNDANYAQAQLDRLRRIALRYTPHKQDEDEYDDDIEEENELPYNVKISQIMYQNYKQTIIRKPVIATIEDLNENDKRLTFMPKCYGNWKRNSASELNYYCDERLKVCPKGNGKLFPYPISPSYVRLDVLMKILLSNPILKETVLQQLGRRKA